MNMTNNIIQNTHRGEPFVFVNDADAADLGIENGEQVRLVNNDGDCLVGGEDQPLVPAGPGHPLQRLRALHARELVQPGRPRSGAT